MPGQSGAERKVGDRGRRSGTRPRGVCKSWKDKSIRPLAPDIEGKE